MATIPLGQMFRTVAPVVDTINKGSLQANSLREAFTMQDIINTVPSGGTVTGSGSVGKVPEFNPSSTSIQNSVMGVSGIDMTLQKAFNHSSGTQTFGFDSASNFKLASSAAVHLQTSPTDTTLYHGAAPLERLRTHKGLPPGPNSIGVVVNGQADLAALNNPPSFGSAGTGVEGEIRYAQSGGSSYIFLSPTTNTFPSGNWKRLLLETWV